MPFLLAFKFRRFTLTPLGLGFLMLATGAAAQLPGTGWALAWSDEFGGTSLDGSKWGVTTGARRDAQNTGAAVTVGGGAMTISTYTEGGVHKTGFVGSSGKFQDAFGYWEARIRFTSRDGMWSAFWIQPTSINNTGNNPNANGTEIDVVEHRNKDSGGATINNRIAINIHWDGYGADHKSVGTNVANPGGTGLQGNWHNFGVLWEQGIYRFYIDGTEVWSQSAAISHVNQFIYLTSEVENGGWAGNIPSGGYGAKGAGTNAKMEVDWVRYWRRAEKVSNGQFTGRLGNWSGYGNYSWTSSNGGSGGAGVRVNPTSSAGAAAEQTVYGLLGGADYILTGWGRLTQAGTQDLRIGVKNYGGAQVLEAITGTTYEQVTVPFTTGLTNSSARIFAWVPVPGGETVADDFRIRRAAAVMDAGFESGEKDEFWSPYGDTLVHSWQPVRSGGQAFRFNAPTADRGMEQTVVGLSPATDYRFSCWMRTDNQLLRLGAKNYGGADTSTAKTVFGNTWARHEHAFTTGAANTSATLYAWIPAANHNSVVDVDDFFLAEPLPSGWTATEIGTVALPGESGRHGSRWVLRAGGSDIWSTADSFRFLHTTLTGDGVIRARLRSFETGQTVSKFGIMLRSSLDPAAPNLYLGWRGDERMETIRRLTAGASSSADTTEPGDRVEWVRLHRQGNTFTASTSADGLLWQTLGAPQTIAMPATIFAGLAGTAASSAEWVEGTADNLSVAPNTAPAISPLADQQVAENGASAAISFTIGDSESAASALTLSAVSTDPQLLPESGVVFGGSGTDRTVTLVPAAGRHGIATVTVSVSDGTLSASESFLLTVTPPTGGSITVAISSSADDAEESSTGDVSLTSTDLELVNDGARGDQTVGLRFAGVAIPAGAIVTAAHLQFKADETQSGETVLDIAAEASDNAATFAANNGNLTSRPVLATSVLWQPTAWETTGESGAPQQSPSLASLVQEIVSRPGWASGNAIAFLITGTGHRTAEARDKSGGTAARLTVDFQIPQAVTTVTKAISASSDDAEESATGTVSLTSTDLELINDSAGGAGDQIVGIRFAGIEVPAGALIHSAAVQFSADEVQTAAAALTIRGAASSNIATFAAANNNISLRPTTAASVAWNPPAWNVVGETAAAQRTPDLAPIVQDIVNRPGWASGNALAFIITGSGRRTADSYDDTNALPAILTISYSTAPPQAGYSQWLGSHPQLAGLAAERTADPDRDSFNNLLEYALGTNPSESTAVPWSVDVGNGVLSLIYNRPGIAPDLTYQVEWSDTLGGAWTSAGVVQQILAENGLALTVRASVAASSGRRFLRLVVHSNP